MSYNLVFRITVFSVFLSWFAFSLVWIVLYFYFAVRKKVKKIKTRRRSPKSMIGIVVQMIAFAIIFSMRRNFSIALDNPGILLYLLTVISVFLAPYSVFIAIYAVITLGKQWSFAARVIDDHELITSGPYKIVRHPIYFAFFGLFLSTGFVITPPGPLLVAIAFFVVGNSLRIQAEEYLLIETFGDRYLEYKKKVRAFIPFIY